VTAAEAAGVATTVVDGSGDGIAGVDATAGAGDPVGAAGDAPQALTSTPVAIARTKLPGSDRRRVIPAL